MLLLFSFNFVGNCYLDFYHCNFKTKFYTLQCSPYIRNTFTVTVTDRIADKGTATPIKPAKSKNVANDWEITNSNETLDPWPLNRERTQSRSFALIEGEFKRLSEKSEKVPGLPI